MAELVAVGFDNPNEADRALTELARLQREYLIDLEDAVVAIRDAEGRLRLKQSVDFVGAGAASGGLWGAMWGSLVGLLFLNPLVGLVAGAALGAGSGRCRAASPTTASTTTSSARSARRSSPTPLLSSCWCAKPSQRRCWPRWRASAVA